MYCIKSDTVVQELLMLQCLLLRSSLMSYIVKGYLDVSWKFICLSLQYYLMHSTANIFVRIVRWAELDKLCPNCKNNDIMWELRRLCHSVTKPLFTLSYRNKFQRIEKGLNFHFNTVFVFSVSTRLPHQINCKHRGPKLDPAPAPPPFPPPFSPHHKTDELGHYSCRHIFLNILRYKVIFSSPLFSRIQVNISSSVDLDQRSQFTELGKHDIRTTLSPSNSEKHRVLLKLNYAKGYSQRPLHVKVWKR